MSIQAMVWALEDAPDVPAQALGTLMGLANHADEFGRGAYASQEQIAEYARKSDRQARTDLYRLEELGLIRRGDQSLVAHLRGDKRPVVWDLAMERRKNESGRKSTSGRKHTSGGNDASGRKSSAPDAPDESAGQNDSAGSTLPGGSEVPAGSAAQNGRKCASDEPSVEPSELSLPTGEKDTHAHTREAAEPDQLFDAPSPKAKPKAKRRKAGNAEPDERDLLADELARAFWNRHRTAQPFPAVRQVIRTALGNGYSRDELAFALERLGLQGMAISGATITIAHKEITQERAKRNGGRDSPGDGSGPRNDPNTTYSNNLADY